MSDLVGNPEDRFSCVAAQLSLIKTFYAVMHQSFVMTVPHLWGGVGDSWPKGRGNYVLIVPEMQRK